MTTPRPPRLTPGVPGGLSRARVGLGKVFVYKKDGGSVLRQQVIVGESNENEIVIREGLTENEEVMLVPPEKAEKLKMVQLDFLI